jgi:hypothetical protein
MVVRDDTTAERTLSELGRIKRAEERLRRKKIALLRAHLVNLRKQADSIERELRALGDTEATRSAGRIDWTALFERLAATFTARELSDLTGAHPRHVAAITHRWRQEKRITTVGRGTFRKLSRQKGP